MDLIVKFSADDAGASAVEYSLLVALIALVVATGISNLGIAVRDSLLDSNGKMFGGS